MYQSNTGYQIQKPAAWSSKQKAGAEILFSDPNNRSTTVGVTVNPVRVSSLAAFGGREDVSEKLLAAEKKKACALCAHVHCGNWKHPRGARVCYMQTHVALGCAHLNTWLREAVSPYRMPYRQQHVHIHTADAKLVSMFQMKPGCRDVERMSNCTHSINSPICNSSSRCMQESTISVDLLQSDARTLATGEEAYSYEYELRSTRGCKRVFNVVTISNSKLYIVNAQCKCTEEGCPSAVVEHLRQITASFNLSRD